VRNKTEAPKRYRYTGKERDEESGLYYHGARFYISWLGRWTSYDPIIFVNPDRNEAKDQGPDEAFENYQRESPYVYGSSNPIKFIDPTGKENIIVVGAQHDTSAANKLMFVEQGISQLRDYASNEAEESRAFLIFREGYTAAQLNAIRTEVQALGVRFEVLDSAADLISYINTTSFTTSVDPALRGQDRVSNLDIYSHGVVGNIEFGYSTPQAANYRFDAAAVRQLNPGAFGPDRNSREDRISSYACRTGLGNPAYNTVGGLDVRPEASLAQQLADQTRFGVQAYITRTDYSATLGTSEDRHSGFWGRLGNTQTAELAASMARRRDINGATFDPQGALHPVRVHPTAPTPVGLPVPYIRRFSPRAGP
jgi:RHS repeat-associated protein